MIIEQVVQRIRQIRQEFNGARIGLRVLHRHAPRSYPVKSRSTPLTVRWAADLANTGFGDGYYEIFATARGKKRRIYFGEIKFNSYLITQLHTTAELEFQAERRAEAFSSVNLTGTMTKKKYSGSLNAPLSWSNPVGHQNELIVEDLRAFRSKHRALLRLEKFLDQYGERYDPRERKHKTFRDYYERIRRLKVWSEAILRDTLTPTLKDVGNGVTRETLNFVEEVYPHLINVYHQHFEQNNRRQTPSLAAHATTTQTRKPTIKSTDSLTISRRMGKSKSYGDNESRELLLIGETFRIVAEAGHIFRPTSNSDWGIDGEIEFKDGYGRASGYRIYLQLKSGNSHLYFRKSDGKEMFSVKNRRHLEYWTKQAYQVFLVIRNSDGLIRWMNITEYLIRTGIEIKQIEFQGVPFTPESVARCYHTSQQTG